MSDMVEEEWCENVLKKFNKYTAFLIKNHVICKTE